MKCLFLLIFSSIFQLAIGQNIEKISVQSTDPHSLYVNDNDATSLFYYRMLPKDKPIGVLTILPSGGETTEKL